jgi:hypothetical protein
MRTWVVGSVGLMSLGLLLLAHRPGGWSLAALGALTLIFGLARHSRPSTIPSPLRVEAQCSFGRESGVALLWAEGQPFLVTYGPTGTELHRIATRLHPEVHHGN